MLDSGDISGICDDLLQCVCVTSYCELSQELKLFRVEFKKDGGSAS